MTQTQNSPKKVASATMIGTTIEYFDNYIYAMATVLVFNHQFFQQGDATSNQIAALYTLALNLMARPIGAILFGHYGDKIGRKNALVISLMLMGISTVVIGFLPTYADIGIWATILLFLCRFGQGIGLGGEWGGAALVAVENAPSHRRAWYAMFPQLGAAVGLFLANLVFLGLAYGLGQQAVIDWAWRIPFIASAILVVIGLYIRFNLYESQIFNQAQSETKLQTFPLKSLFRTQSKTLFKATLIAIIGYVQFYMVVIFGQIYAKSEAKLSDAGHVLGLGLPTTIFTQYLLISAVVFAMSILVSGYLCDRFGRKTVLLCSTTGIAIFGLSLPLLLASADSLLLFLILGMTLLGANFGPMAIILPELFKTEVRYSGASLSFNFAGILGASVATIVAIKLNAQYGLISVGIYMVINAIISLIGLMLIQETKQNQLTKI